jgi:hypothetical protein
MLSAIDLDDQIEFSANEVADVAADRNLPDKLVSIDLPIANTIPENRLCVRLIDPAIALRFGWSFHCGHALPCPSPGSQERSDLSR